jgi:hypothetical protein
MQLKSDAVPHLVKFNWRAYDTIRYPLPSGPISLFTDQVSYCPDRVTAKAEEEILNWLLATPPARSVLLANLELPTETYAQTSIIEPILDRWPTRKPGDLDMLLLPHQDDPSGVISIQAKRVKVEATSTDHDRVSHRHLGNLATVIEQANGSREIGFHLNYAMVIIQIDGMERSEFNFLARNTTEAQFNRIYHRTWNSPLHSDVGIIFVEIAQPTGASIDDAGVIAIAVDKPAKPLEQPVSLNAKVRQFTRHVASL